MIETQREAIPFARLMFAPGNPNSMTADEKARLVAAIKEIGTLLDPLLVRQLVTGERIVYEVVDGEHRAHACRDAGVDPIECVVVTGMSDAQARALRIGMNKLRGSLDIGRVGTEIADILGPLGMRDDVADVLSLVGYGHDELQTILELTRASGAEDVIGLAAGGAPPEEDRPTGKGDGASQNSRVLTLRFATAKEAQAARDALARLDDDPAKALQLLLTRRKRARKDKNDE